MNGLTWLWLGTLYRPWNKWSQGNALFSFRRVRCNGSLGLVTAKSASGLFRNWLSHVQMALAITMHLLPSDLGLNSRIHPLLTKAGKTSLQKEAQQHGLWQVGQQNLLQTASCNESRSFSTRRSFSLSLGSIRVDWCPWPKKQRLLGSKAHRWPLPVCYTPLVFSHQDGHQWSLSRSICLSSLSSAASHVKHVEVGHSRAGIAAALLQTAWTQLLPKPRWTVGKQRDVTLPRSPRGAFRCFWTSLSTKITAEKGGKGELPLQNPSVCDIYHLSFRHFH